MVQASLRIPMVTIMLSGYPNRVNASTTEAGFIRAMTPLKSSPSTGRALMTYPVQSIFFETGGIGVSVATTIGLSFLVYALIRWWMLPSGIILKPGELEVAAPMDIALASDLGQTIVVLEGYPLRPERLHDVVEVVADTPGDGRGLVRPGELRGVNQERGAAGLARDHAMAFFGVERLRPSLSS